MGGIHHGFFRHGLQLLFLYPEDTPVRIQISQGGIYDVLLAARLAADTIATAFASNGFTAQAMGRYERRW
jgi:hypothetical protein